MSEQAAYSFKVDKGQLRLAKRFFDRQETPLQSGLRDLIDLAADCEKCLELDEEDASISELQSAFATLLADCKSPWQLGSLLQEAIMKIANNCKVPMEFINNVLDEAERVKPAVRRI